MLSEHDIAALEDLIAAIPVLRQGEFEKSALVCTETGIIEARIEACAHAEHDPGVATRAAKIARCFSALLVAAPELIAAHKTLLAQNAAGKAEGVA